MDNYRKAKQKMDKWEEQQKYTRPESHPDSPHPEPHYHDANKSQNPKVNRHHTWGGN